MSTDALDAPTTTGAPTETHPDPAPACVSSPALPEHEPTTAELDVLGFSRRGAYATALDALWRLLNGFTDYDTPESEAARKAIETFNTRCKPKERLPISHPIAKHSQAWRDAQTAGITLHPIPAPPTPPQQDLFSTPPRDVARYAIAEEDLCNPISYGGDAPYPDDIIDEYGMLEHWSAFAWDAERILITCPRGVCLVPRHRWAEGWRCCPAC